MNKKRVYSPTQAAMGSFLGGPLASVMYVHHNYRALGNADGQRKTLILGAIAVLALLAILPFLPEHFPNMAIPLATIIVTRLVVEKTQFTKQAIVSSESLAFQSNWRVAGVGLLSLVVFLVVAVGWMMGLEQLGLVTFD